MATEVRIPKLGKQMEDATIVEFLVKEDDEVKAGDVLFEIETDKASVEIESPTDGFVKVVLAEKQRALAPGQAVLILGQKNEKIPKRLIDSLQPVYLEQNQTFVDDGNQLNNISAEAIETKTSSADASLGSTIPMSRWQKKTAEKMLASKRSKPCFYLSVNADVTELVEFREKINSQTNEQVSYNAFLIKAVSQALQKFPMMAGFLEGNEIRLANTINIALAVSVGDNVVAPVVKDVQDKTLVQINDDISKLAEKAQSGTFEPAELEGACITISNLGAFGVESFIPIVVPPQCSILGAGAIIEACIPDNSGMSIRKLMSLTISVDHRIANGAYAAEFMDFLRKILEDVTNFN
jgi:pyruvate dehydrogenase E2 component (dihydrolipoamide acetyltransferase)